MADKYSSDNYDRELYIPKGFILRDGTQLGKEYARLHVDMAKKFVGENYHESFQRDIIPTEIDYMIFRLGALQVLFLGKPIILYADEHQNKVIQDAIASYVTHGWYEIIKCNPYCSVNNYIRSRLLENTLLFYEEAKYEEETGNVKVFKRRR